MTEKNPSPAAKEAVQFLLKQRSVISKNLNKDFREARNKDSI